MPLPQVGFTRADLTLPYEEWKTLASQVRERLDPEVRAWLHAWESVVTVNPKLQRPNARFKRAGAQRRSALKPLFGCVWGSTRLVLLIGRWAIKLPRPTEWRLFLLGMLANMQEAQWSGFDPKLCPVVLAGPGGTFVVMARAETLSEYEWGAMDVDTWRMSGGVHLPVEDKLDSFGRIGANIVAVDYGS